MFINVSAAGFNAPDRNGKPGEDLNEGLCRTCLPTGRLGVNSGNNDE